MSSLLSLFRQGGKGSGNFGHKGRLGQVGGSTKSYKENFLDYSRNLSKEDKYVVRRYTGGDYNGINAYLRRGKKVSPNIIDRAERLKTIIDNGPPFGEPVKLWRGISGSPEKYGMTEGGVFRDRGFISSSLTQGYGSHESLSIIIHAKPHQKGIFVGEIGGHVSENEVILPPSTFRILSIKSVPARYEFRGKYDWVVELEMLDE